MYEIEKENLKKMRYENNPFLFENQIRNYNQKQNLTYLWLISKKKISALLTKSTLYQTSFKLTFFIILIL